MKECDAQIGWTEVMLVYLGWQHWGKVVQSQSFLGGPELCLRWRPCFWKHIRKYDSSQEVGRQLWGDSQQKWAWLALLKGLILWSGRLCSVLQVLSKMSTAKASGNAKQCSSRKLYRRVGNFVLVRSTSCSKTTTSVWWGYQMRLIWKQRRRVILKR